MRQFLTIIFLVLFGAIILPLLTSANREQDNKSKDEPLKLQAPVTREIRGGEKQSFQINVEARQYARAEIIQRDIDVVVSLYAPGGKLIVEMDGKDGRLWREAVSCIADSGGEYRLEVKAYGASDKVGSYTAKLNELREAKAADHKRGEAESLLAEGRKLYEQGGSQHLEAIRKYEAAAALWRELGEEYWEGVAFVNLGWTYSNLSQNEKALESQSHAAEILRKANDKIGEANALNGFGDIYRDLGQPEKALSYYEQALLISREVKDRSGEGLALWGLMYLLGNQNRPQLAIFYGKQAVNTFQEIRGNIRNLDKELQQSFLKDKERLYRQLADILISEGRIPEAQQVVDLLKDEEFSRLVRRSGAGDFIPYSKAETAAIAIIDHLATLGRERNELLKVASFATQPDKKKRLDEIDEQIAVANKVLRVSLDALASSEISAKDKITEVKNERVLRDTLRSLGQGAVALYTIIASENQPDNEKDKLEKVKVGWVILVTPDFPGKAYPIDVGGIEKTVFAFRDALRSDKYDPTSLAQELYRRIFLQTSDKQKTTLAEDLETYLGKQDKKTLMWSLDGVLRYVPMAALHDGKQYMVERYRNVVFNTASLPSLKDAVSKKWQALGYGVTEAREEAGKKFAALNGAERELRSIIRDAAMKTSKGIVPGTIKLNQDFTKESLIDGLRSGAPLVHIASHFSYNTATPEQSFLLLGKNHLSVEAMQDLNNPFDKVELLTLSACDTAMGGANGKEVEGFAYVAQSLGAKSVIASLWPISDTGTDELMVRFYKIRKDNPNLSKSEAFNLAQRSLLKGEEILKREGRSGKRSADGNADRSARVTDKALNLPLYKADAKRPFAHPHYWAAFIMIGNWK